MTSDFTESNAIAKRMVSATKRLHEMAPDVGHAKQVREFNSDRRKNILSEESVKFLIAGDSVAAAELKARATETYKAKLENLEKQFQEAEATICRWCAENASFEASRSLLSFSKATITEL